MNASSICPWLVLAALGWYLGSSPNPAAAQTYYPVGTSATDALLQVAVEVDPLAQVRQQFPLALTVTVTNITAEGAGNGREEIVEGIDFALPLPPAEWYDLSELATDRGEVNLAEEPMDLCVPARLGVISGFAVDSDQLDQPLQQQLDAVIGRMDPARRYQLAGHTDPRGRPAYNQALSLRRALTVEGILIEEGFPDAQLEAVGFGERQLLEQRGDDDFAGARQVGVYPVLQPVLRLSLAELKPRETATVRLTLTPAAWIDPVRGRSLVGDNPCYGQRLDFQATRPTLPELTLAAELRRESPGGDSPWGEAVDLSRCDVAQLRLGLANAGPRSAQEAVIFDTWPDNMGLVGDFPPSAQFNPPRRLRFRPAPLAVGERFEASYRLQVRDHQGATDLTRTTRFEGAAVTPVAEVVNRVRWFDPQLTLTVDGTPSAYPSETLRYTIAVANPGSWPIHDLVVEAQLPTGVGVPETPGGEVDGGEVRWQLGRLDPAAQRDLTLALPVATNRAVDALEARFRAFDRAYGGGEDNPCVSDAVRHTARVRALAPPEFTIRSRDDGLALGNTNEYLVTLRNPNGLALPVTLKAQLDPAIIQPAAPQVTAALTAADGTRRPYPLALNLDDSGQLALIDPAEPLTLGPNQGLEVRLPLRIVSLGDDALVALAANLTSAFNITSLRFHVSALEGLVVAERTVDTIIYR